MREDKDTAFVIQFDFDATLLQDLTRSHRLLERALDQVETPGLQRRGANGRWGYPGGRGGGPMGRRGGGTVLYDAVLLASDELMRKQSGRKALIVLSDGLDNGSRSTLFQAEESAQ